MYLPIEAYKSRLVPITLTYHLLYSCPSPLLKQKINQTHVFLYPLLPHLYLPMLSNSPLSTLNVVVIDDDDAIDLTQTFVIGGLIFRASRYSSSFSPSSKGTSPLPVSPLAYIQLHHLVRPVFHAAGDQVACLLRVYPGVTRCPTSSLRNSPSPRSTPLE